MKNTMGRIARTAAAAGLSIALALGGVAPSVALAEGENGTGTGTLVLNRAEGNTATSYKAIKIFKADVGQSSGEWVAEGLDWATDATKTVVEAAINKYSSDHHDVPEYTGTTAQDAADFMVRYIQGTNNRTIVGPNDFANTLANYLATALIDRKVDGSPLSGDLVSQDINSTPTPADSTGDRVNTLTEGYYLVVTDLTTAPTGSAATSPILLMMGQGQNLSINEKVKIPTIEKTVREDSAPTVEVHHADAQVGQVLPFTLKGTVSGNIANYTSYYYKFTDELPKGMDVKVNGGTDANALDAGDVVVKVNNNDSTDASKRGIYTITGGFTPTYDAGETKNTLTVEFTNLLAATGKINPSDEATAVPIDSSSIVTVEYEASLNANAVAGVTGNTNSAHITYNTTPNVGNTGNTTDSTATVYEYSLKLVKLDKDHELDNSSTTSTPLPGAVFTIKAKTTDEGTNNNGKYLKNDGTFGETTLPADATAKEAYLFTTNANGEITAKGLDAGTYTIHEETAPGSYKRLAADLELTISVIKVGTTKAVQSVEATLSGGEADGVDTSEPKDDKPDKGTRAVVDASGNITVYATNQKEERLPLTGLSGITLVYVAGGAILAVSLVAIVRRRMKDQG